MTDISVEKYLCVCVRYYSDSTQIVITDFLGLITVESTTANDLYNYLTQILGEYSFHLENLISIGTDKKSNLCRKNHTLYTLLKQKNN